LRRRNPFDADHLAGRLHVDGAHAESDRALEFGARLSDAGDDDVGGREAGAQRDFEFAAGIDVRAGAQRLQPPRDAERRVGFERVVQPMRRAE
jgi:hypothetical protein